MKYIVKISMTLFLVFSCIQLNAQTGTIDFTLSSESINMSGQDIAISSTLNKIGNTLVWTQSTNNTTDTTNFSINNTTGNWDENTSTGSLIYVIVIEDYQGLFVLEGTASGFTVSLSLNKNGTEQQQYIFKTNSITYL